MPRRPQRFFSLDVLRPTTPDRQVKEDALSEDDHEERGEVQRI
jgi:hypothetical protein